MGGRFHSTVPQEILAGGGPSSIGNPCPGQVHHRIETFQVGMILEDNPGMPRNPRAVGFGSDERENVVPLLRKALGEHTPIIPEAPLIRTRMVVDYPMRITGEATINPKVWPDPAVGRVQQEGQHVGHVFGCSNFAQGVHVLGMLQRPFGSGDSGSQQGIRRPGAMALIRMPLRA